MNYPSTPFDVSLFLSALGCGVSLVMILIIARDFFESIAAKLFIFLVLGGVCHLLHPWIPVDYHPYSYIVQSATPALFWMCCRITFVPREQSRLILWGVAYYSFLAPLVFHLIGRPDFLLFLLKGIPQWLEYLLVIAGAWEVMSNWNNDLVEARRRLRGGIMIAAGLTVGWSIVSFNMNIGSASSRFLAIDISFITLAWLLLQGRSELWALIPKHNLEPDTLPHAAQPTSIIQEDEALDQLYQLMNTGFYRKENLTLKMLAKKLSLPEYRLRSTINTALKYNNFNEYINELRIGEASDRLLKEPDTPITNIALDVGYRTMSSFNRAFRKIHNSTPSDYREKNTR